MIEAIRRKYLKWAISVDFDPRIISFLEAFPDVLLLDSTPKHEGAATGSSWQRVNTHLKTNGRSRMMPIILNELLGEELADRFQKYIQERASTKATEEVKIELLDINALDNDLIDLLSKTRANLRAIAEQRPDWVVRQVVKGNEFFTITPFGSVAIASP